MDAKRGIYAKHICASSLRKVNLICRIPTHGKKEAAAHAPSQRRIIMPFGQQKLLLLLLLKGLVLEIGYSLHVKTQN